ncbi:MAG: DnaD domain protein [Bacilli bacterium]|nr:DnaD domain protein [Bacilli bacterium]
MLNKEFLSSKKFVFNSFILEKLDKFKLTKEELLLMIYFLNSENISFDIDEITKSLKISKANVLSSLNMLIEKNLIELKTDNSKKGNIREYVSLNKFYEYLDESKETNNEERNVIIKYMKDKIALEPKDIEVEFISVWLDRGFSQDYIKSVIDRAVLDNKRDIRYIDKLLYESTQNSNNEPKSELFDYNWLDEKK